MKKAGYLTESDSDVKENDITAPEGPGSYGALLFDKRWRLKQVDILTRDSALCVICKSKTGVQVHHRQYHFIKNRNQFKLPWDYDHQVISKPTKDKRTARI